MMTEQELQQELLQLLKEGFKQLKEELKSRELMINKGFVRLLGILMEKPEDSANKVNSSSNLVSPMLNRPEFEGVEPEPDTRPVVKEIKPHVSDMATHLVMSKEASIEATSEAKNTKPLANKPPKHTELNLRSSSETRKLTYGEDEASIGGEVSPGSNRQQKRSVGQILIFPVTNQALQWNYHRFRPTLSRVVAVVRLPTPFPGEDRRRSRPERLLLVFLVDNQAPKEGTDRRCAVVPLPVFDPGGYGSFEEEGLARLRFRWSLGHFGRILDEIRWWIKESELFLKRTDGGSKRRSPVCRRRRRCLDFR